MDRVRSVPRFGGARLERDSVAREMEPRAVGPGLLVFMDVRRKEVSEVRKKHRKQKAITAFDVALAACRALVPTDLRPKPDLRRATVLAKFAVAMTK